MVLNRFVKFLLVVHVFVSGGFSQIIHFESLDHSNALNSEYHDFKWSSWKVAIAFVSPAITKDSLCVQERIFKDICPNQTFYNFLLEEITHIILTKSQFMAVEWHPIPLKKEMKSFTYRDDLYYISIPDSAIEIFRNTGCRFVLLLQKFYPRLTLIGSKYMSIIYQKAIPAMTQYENYGESRMRFSFSFSYVLYDLMEDKVVQFGKAFDDNKSQKVTVGEIKHCLESAIIDVLEVSKFYYK